MRRRCLLLIFAAIFLGERIRLFRLSAVALGLIGVMIVIAPRLSVGSETMTSVATLGAGLVYGCVHSARLGADPCPPLGANGSYGRHRVLLFRDGKLPGPA